jgi:hypothetical protein
MLLQKLAMDKKVASTQIVIKRGAADLRCTCRRRAYKDPDTFYLEQPLADFGRA